MINVMSVTRAILVLFAGLTLVHCGDESECPSTLAICQQDGAIAADAGLGEGQVGADSAGLDGSPAQDQAVVDASLGDDGSGDYVHENVSVAQVAAWIDESAVMTLLDVREPSEYAAGHLSGAINMALGSGVLEKDMDQLPQDRPLVVYCASGNRSDRAATLLTKQGFRPVYDMLGGYGAWLRAGLPVEK